MSSVLESIRRARRENRRENIEIIVAFDVAPEPDRPDDNSAAIRSIIESLGNIVIPGVIITLIESRVNQGVNTMRNWIISNASGKRLMFFDGDDKLLPDTIYNVLEVIEERDEDIISFTCEFKGFSGYPIGDKAVWGRVYKVRSILRKIGPELFIHQGRSADGPAVHNLRGAGLSEILVERDIIKYDEKRGTQTMSPYAGGCEFSMQFNQIAQMISNMVKIGIKLDFKAEVDLDIECDSGKYRVMGSPNSILTTFGTYCGGENMGYGCFLGFRGTRLRMIGEDAMLSLYSIAISMIMYPGVLKDGAVADTFRNMRRQIMEISFASVFGGENRETTINFIKTAFEPIMTLKPVRDDFCKGFAPDGLFDEFCNRNADSIAKAFEESKKETGRHHTGEPDNVVLISRVSEYLDLEYSRSQGECFVCECRSQEILRMNVFLRLAFVEEQSIRLASGLLHYFLERGRMSRSGRSGEESERRIMVYDPAVLSEPSLSEAMEQFNDKRVKDFMARVINLPPQEMFSCICKAMKSFEGAQQEQQEQQKQSKVVEV
jgi:glycosyltransferase involved in cell wall biosynthesis